METCSLVRSVGGGGRVPRNRKAFERHQAGRRDLADMLGAGGFVSEEPQKYDDYVLIVSIACSGVVGLDMLHASGHDLN